jgi:hypothetical protein
MIVTFSTPSSCKRLRRRSVVASSISTANTQLLAPTAPSQTIGEESVAGFDVSDDGTSPDTHLGENGIDLLPLLPATSWETRSSASVGGRRDNRFRIEAIERLRGLTGHNQVVY